MRTKSTADRGCAYVVSIERTVSDIDDLRVLSEYLSTLGTAGCEVIVLDSSPRAVFDENRRVLRWVAGHVAVAQPVDLVRTAAAVAQSDAVIVAREDVRYTAEDIERVCGLLAMHEVVEPQDYLDPLPWWGGIEAGRMLIHRGAERTPDHGATFAFRRSALGILRGFDGTDVADPVRRMAAFGAEVFSAFNVFVRRQPPRLLQWLRDRPRAAGADFATPAKALLFFALIPTVLLVALFAGGRAAAGYAMAIAFASIVLAMRGRAGASAFFPWRVCLYAPLWVVERSVSVYWALFWKLQHIGEPAHAVVAERGRREKVASGE